MELIAGDDIVFTVDLTKNGKPFVIPISAKVKAAIVDKNNSQILAGPIAITGSEVESNWTNSRVVCMFPSTVTGNIKSTMQGKIQIQVDDNGKTTWITDVILVKGLIK